MRVSLLGIVLLVACGNKPDTPSPEGPPGGSEARFGPLMLQIGQRLELSGRAARAGRWELAAYEVQELREIYEGPLLDAPAPEEIHARIEPFAASCLLPLEEAAQSRDMARFEREFATTSIGCNACHQAASVPFVEIPSELEVEVPRMTPL
jgi:hypothetical protein